MRTWLKDLRLKKGYTQQDVAKKCNISRSYYTHIESGTKTPTVKITKQIAKVLGFNWTIFFDNKCSLKEQNTA